MKPFKCKTIAQFKIGVWLAEQGIEPEDIQSAELLALDTVKITNQGGQYMILRWNEDANAAEIDQTPE